MCGICGKLVFNSEDKVETRRIKDMMDVMDHRGPDGEGMFISGSIGLGHKRLSIIDLETGRQPMSNEDDSIWVIFNGEIYNYKELRSYLLGKGHILKTESDTEVIVHLYEDYGKKLMKKLRGMFAFALWDEKNEVLLLARDRVGIKPLYYSVTKNSLVFASEMKAVLKDSAVQKEVNFAIVERFLTYFYVPGSETLIRNLHKLKPGHYLIARRGKVEVKQYWDLNFADVRTKWSFEGLKEQLIDIVRESVRLHMTSDVPIGFLLSGGVDSTSLMSFATEDAKDRISTFTIGFEGERFADERHYARLASEKFGGRHYETTITSREFINFLPKFIWHMEEPVCEPPAIALYYVSRLAKEYVKVLISGEGGDEAFAGYPDYRNILMLEYVKRILGPLNGPLCGFLRKVGGFLEGNRLGKYAPMMGLPLQEYYYSRTSTPSSFFCRKYGELYSTDFLGKLDRSYSRKITEEYFDNVSDQSTLNKMLYIDTKTWLPDDLLIKADKITMANSVELRVPFLDHNVLEFAASLPASYKVNKLRAKHILKQAFKNRVPKEIIRRKKSGFPVPYESWLRTDLGDTVRDVLLDKKSLERGYFNERFVRRLLMNESSYVKLPKELFALLDLELWHRIFIDNASVTLN